jgi:uncharacterized protein YndB with AHSA1/START domain
VSHSIALVIRRTINASVARVFEAWTQPEQLRRWWGPRPVTCSAADVDLRVGGEYRIGNLLPDGTVVYTWEIERKGKPSPERSRVTVRFEAHDDKTEVIVVHERIDTDETRADHEQGWNGCLDGLAALFTAGSVKTATRET